MSGAATRWRQRPAAPQKYLDEGAEHPVLLRILYNRGVQTPQEVAPFLQGDDARQENPFDLPNMVRAVERVVEAIRHGQIICVYGDFDADGICSTALLVEALAKVGARVGHYIPDRIDEGYGLNREAIASIRQKGAALVITVDCGIRGVSEIEEANRLGLDVIVTDHHSTGPVLPAALAVVNPKLVPESPASILAGVGVAFRLAQAVVRALSQQPWSPIDPERASEIEETLLDLVAMGTVADMVPLVGQNRSLVRRGLKRIASDGRIGLQALRDVARVGGVEVDSGAISFRLAPRINAAGRLSQAGLAYQLLRSRQYEEAFTLAQQLEALNRERQDLTQRAQETAHEQLRETPMAELPILFASSSDFQSGIVGLVAGRLSEEAYRPAVVIEEGPEECRGSARSIDDFDIISALDQLADLLERHGGHQRAAGFTIRREHLDEFRRRLTEIAAEKLNPLDELRPTLWVDGELSFDEIDWALYEQLRRLEPTGQKNPAPLFLLRNARPRSLRQIGSGRHLKMTLDQNPGSAVLDGIAFRQGERISGLENCEALDLLFHLEENEWNGRRSLQLNIQDMREAEGERLSAEFERGN